MKYNPESFHPPNKLYKTAKFTGIKPRNQNASRSKKRDRHDASNYKNAKSSKKRGNKYKDYFVSQDQIGSVNQIRHNDEYAIWCKFLIF